MNMKKTLAGLMAGVVAISAMATVAVSAKAQKAETVTWSTMAKETKNAVTTVYVQINHWAATDTLTFTLASVEAADVTATAAAGTAYAALTAADKDALATLGISAKEWDAAVTGNSEAALIATNKAAIYASIEVKELTKINNRTAGSNEPITDDLDTFFTFNANVATAIANDPLTGIGAAAAVPTYELIFKVEAPFAITTNDLTVTHNPAAGGGPLALQSRNKKADTSDKKIGVLVNMPNGADAEVYRDMTYAAYSLDNLISVHMKGVAGVIEPSEEIADTLKDAKNATIEFAFDKQDIDDSVTDNEFDEWFDRYDWNADSMKSAISLRINNSNVLSVDMMEFNKDTFTAVYSWDEVMAKFQVGSVTGLVNNMSLKVNNSKLPAKKDKSKEVIELRLKSITVKIPELADTKDDSMVEDFAAGESVTQVEDTLPAATDAPAATNAPAATDAPATTDGAANPETGNSAIALLAIPAALAAAAIVAKKRG